MFVKAFHCSGTELKLEIAFFGKMHLRIDRGKKRGTNTDNMGSVIPVDFSEESQIEV